MSQYHSFLPCYISSLVRLLRPTRTFCRSFTSTAHHRLPEPKPIPSIPTCPPPPPLCRCQPTPEGLAIDHERQMNISMPPYAQHVVVRTGRQDWNSKIEDEPHTLDETIGGGNIARNLKDLLGKGGELHDPSWPILITNCSAPRNTVKDALPNPSTDFQALYLFPQHIVLPNLANTPESIRNFAQTFLVRPRKETRAYWDLLRSQKKNHEILDVKGFPTQAKWQRFPKYNPIDGPMILICAHQSRDSRCGTLGPILRKEFKEHVNRAVFAQDKRTGHHTYRPRDKAFAMRPANPLRYTLMTFTSCIGGHAYAGNVVIYLPKNWKGTNGESVSPLAGKGVWYGRVEPRHVWGIIEETVNKGRIIEERLRGVHENWRDELVPESERGDGIFSAF